MHNDLEDSYIDFLVSIQVLCKGKQVHKTNASIDSVHVFDAHSSVCSAIEGFIMPVIESDWVAFIWEKEVVIYSCSVSDALLTDIHLQSRLN